MAAIKLLREQPPHLRENPYLLSILGSFEVTQGYTTAGLENCRRAADAAPDNLTVLVNFGRQLLAVGRASAALDLLERARKSDRGHPEVEYIYAKACFACGMFDSARDAAMAYRSLVPGDAAGRRLLADALAALGQSDAALAEYRDWSKADRENPEPELRIAELLSAQGHLAEAEKVLQDVAEKCGGIWAERHAQRTYELAMLRGDIERALSLVRAAGTSFTESDHFAYIAATLLLSTGDFPAGWTAFSELPRWGEIISRLPYARWQGESLRDRTLLVRASEGVGEQLILSRFVPQLASSCDGMIVECDHRLVPLLQRANPSVEFVGFSLPAQERLQRGDIDFQCVAADVGRYLSAGTCSFEFEPAPLVPHTGGIAAVEKIRRRWPGKKLIGLSWRSASVSGGDRKSVTLGQLRPIFGAGDHVFVNLQYGDNRHEIEALKMESGHTIETLQGIDTREDIDKVVGAISALDLVVTVSNVTAHYAGIAATPALVLVPKTPLWHWFRDRADSSWYRSVKLFRQMPEENWQPVIERLAAELRDV